MSFTAMIQLQLQLFLLMSIGFICQKINILTLEARKSMSDLLIYVILLSNIIHGFTSGIAVSKELLFNCGVALIISVAVQLVVSSSTKTLFKTWERDKRLVASYGMIVSNSSFIGIPVTETMYGSLGVLYTAIFQIPIRFTMWTAGLKLFTDVDQKNAFKKLATHPCILACVIGFVLMLLDVSIGGFVGNTITALSKCTGPISMLVIGAILADVDVKQVLRKDVFIFSFLRLVGLPFLLWVILRLLRVDPMIIGISVILTAMPAGSTTAILPQKYNMDAQYGAVLIFASTLLSIVTIPLFSLLIGA